MKKIILILVTGLSLNAYSKLNDFNTLIAENSKAQNELHAHLKQNLNETHITARFENQDRFIVDSSDTINVPTTKEFLTYSKEKTYYRVSDKQVQKRLAQEFDSAE